jgi:hypothetical protein
MIFAISLFRRRSVGKETGPSDVLLAEMVCLWGPQLMPLSSLVVDNFSSGTNISQTTVNVPDMEKQQTHEILENGVMDKRL